MEVKSEYLVRFSPLTEEWCVVKTNVDGFDGDVRSEVCLATYADREDAINHVDRESALAEESSSEYEDNSDVGEMSPIDILKSLQRGVVPVARNVTKSLFVVNRGMSQSWENLELASIMDTLGKYIPPENVLLAYASASKKPSSFTKWFKDDKVFEAKVKALMAEHHCSRKVAELYLSTTSQETK